MKVSACTQLTYVLWLQSSKLLINSITSFRSHQLCSFTSQIHAIECSMVPQQVLVTLRAHCTFVMSPLAQLNLSFYSHLGNVPHNLITKQLKPPTPILTVQPPTPILTVQSPPPPPSIYPHCTTPAPILTVQPPPLSSLYNPSIYPHCTTPALYNPPPLSSLYNLPPTLYISSLYNPPPLAILTIQPPALYNPRPYPH